MPRPAIRLALLCLALLAAGAPSWAAPIAPGKGELTADLGGTSLTLFTYRPATCAPGAMVLVFHGVGRDADQYRDAAKSVADKLCLIAVAPLFDRERFPTWRYQRGGVIHDGAIHDGAIQPVNTWTGQYVLRLVDWVRTQEGNPTLPYFLMGHSGGGQFLSRFAAYVPNAAQRIVIANPSSYVMPNLDDPVPYGLGGFPDGAAALQRYLAEPITIFLGQADVGSQNRDDSPPAVKQGPTRYARGLNAFHAAEAAAKAHGWTFNWRLVEVPGVGHSASKMFGAPEAIAALATTPLATPSPAR